MAKMEERTRSSSWLPSRAVYASHRFPPRCRCPEAVDTPLEVQEEMGSYASVVPSFAGEAKVPVVREVMLPAAELVEVVSVLEVSS